MTPSSPARMPPAGVVATAPVRIADVGGWTDTWFGGPGRVCHLAVGPAVTVRATWSQDSTTAPVVLAAPDLNSTLLIHPDPAHGWARPLGGGHPLLEHAVASVLASTELPAHLGIRVDVTSAVPPGASLGTSASVVVALLAALRALLGQASQADALAISAHVIEVERVGREAGVQDQWAAATGGASLLTIDPYPHTHSQPVPLAPATAAEIDARVRTVVFGPHDSSAVHRQVIAAAVRDGSPDPVTASCLRRLAALADHAAGALAAGDLEAWGQALRESTTTQERLHHDLVGPAHRAAIALAQRHGATGWKVNGAGGNGGSLSVLLPDPGEADRFAAAMRDQGWVVPSLALAPGASATSVR